MRYSCVICGITTKAVAAKNLAKGMAAIGSYTLQAGILAGIAFFAARRIYNHGK